MIVEPVFRGTLGIHAHPAGCGAHLRWWIDRARARGSVPSPRRVLVVGSSSGLGLAVRVAAAFGGNATTIGVCLEKAGGPGRVATAGWYRTAEVERAAAEAGLPSRTVLGDAYSDETKTGTVEAIRDLCGQVDLVVYSLAAPHRRHPRTGVRHRSVLKTLGEPFTGKGYVVSSGEVKELTMPVATAAEVADTVAVMGGEDWSMWIDALAAGGVLAPGARTVALSYVGTPRLGPTYRGGTIGAAKDDLERTAGVLGTRLPARIAVMQALVTQSSLAIPMSSLYTLMLLRALGAARQDVFDQGWRLVAEGFADGADPVCDDLGRIRMDDAELAADVQEWIWSRWDDVHTGNVAEHGDLATFTGEMRALYGFDVSGVDYAGDYDPVVPIPGLVRTGG